MKALIFGALLSLIQPAPAEEPAWADFGAGFTVEAVTPAATLLADPASFESRTVRVEGRVADVCQKAGCWMVIAEGDQTMRVLMKDHGFAVARDATGATCQVEGVVTKRVLDDEWVEHLESESADKENMPEKNATAGVIYELEATAVRTRPAG